MNILTASPKPLKRWLAVLVAAALILSACASTTSDATDGSDGSDNSEDSEDSETSTGSNTGLGATADELNTIAVAERFGPSTAALAVSVGGQQMIDGVPIPASPLMQSSGSGFIIEFEGERFIVSNFHVVEATLEPGTSNLRADASITAVFGDLAEEETELDVIGVNPSFDLALLGPTNGELPAEKDAITISDSDEAQLGQKTIAIGNPFSLGATVTTGIVSSTRTFITSIGGVDIPTIQTDAAINPGNSGGPLLNSSGELIGINTAIFAPGGAAASAGIGFAVPANLLTESLVNLQDGGVSMLSDTRPAFGAQLGNIAGLPADIRAEAGLPDSGLAILDVDPDGAAATAGLRVPEFISIMGFAIPVDPDIIIAINGEPVGTPQELTETLTFGLEGEDEAVLTVLRDGQELEVTVSLT